MLATRERPPLPGHVDPHYQPLTRSELLLIAAQAGRELARPYWEAPRV